MAFLDSCYLLDGDAAKTIYDAVAHLPIIDVHNHADVRRIADDVPFTDLWELFAATDHYVWEVERKRSVAEKYITGSASNLEKWRELARVFPEFAGNPIYEWIHLDLRTLGLGGELLCAETADSLWERGLRVLASPEARPQALLKKMGIELMCSTDDPADLLAEHKKANAALGTRMVRPTWRPDAAMKIASPAWKKYLEKLGARFGFQIDTLAKLMEALKLSHDYFAENGAIASDHGIEKPYDGAASEEEAAAVFAKVYAGGVPTPQEADTFSSWLLMQAAELDASKGWVFQMHIGAVRDVRDELYRTLGPDSGGDVSDHTIDLVKPLARFLNRVEGRLKVVLYCLEPGHQSSLAALSRAFGANVRLGSAWWLNDTPVGMRRQLEYIGSVDLYWNFAGMVSDSRKLLSYSSRFEMFRRVLSSVLGTQVERGQIPESLAIQTAKEMCYEGPKKFFHL